MPLALEQPGRFITRQEPLITSLKYGMCLWARKAIVSIALGLYELLNLAPAPSKPTYIKTYPVRPSLRNRIFVPNNYKASGKPLPLLINLHGGGFAIGHPRMDDQTNRVFAEKYGMLVVSIQYRLAPLHPFPTAIHDVFAIAEAILDDERLPFDKDRVAIGGSSAGGTLALAAVQLDNLKARIGGVVLFYPVLDFTRSTEDRLKSRPKVQGQEDKLSKAINWYNWGYLPVGTDPSDPLVSPIFAPKGNLPSNMFIIGCEYDMLCKEAEDMAMKYTEGENGGDQERPVENSWERGGIRWERVIGQEHAFNTSLPGKGDAEVLRLKAVEKMLESVAEWLFRRVYV